MRLEKFMNYTWEDQTLELNYKEAKAAVEVITDQILRFYITAGEKPYHSMAIEGDKKQKVSVELKESLGRFQICTRDLNVSIESGFVVNIFDREGNPLCRDYLGARRKRETLSEKHKSLLVAEGHAAWEDFDKEPQISCMKALDGDEKFYGLGDKTGFLNKKFYEFENWNTDNARAHTEGFKALYKSIPFMIVLKNRGTYGLFFDNTYRSTFDMGKENQEYFLYTADGGELNYYFIGGKSMKEVVSNYTYLTGRTPLPKRWTLGYHQSRWGYDSAAKIREIADNMRKYQIPCDCIHFDIDYMEGFRVFTWDESRYEKKGKLIGELLDEGFHSVCIIDPGVKVDEHYAKYKEGVENDYFAKNPDGSIYNNVVWPGKVAFPDFGKKSTRDWWANNQRFLLDMKVGGIWNDMNEPASFNGPIPDDVMFSDEEDAIPHKMMHNRYGHLMSKATYEGLKNAAEERPFVITRACYAGTQKYSTVWTGDNQSLWAHIQMAIPQLCNLGLSGIGIAGTDVGGFGADTTPELLIRWVQLGIFSPFFRNHSSNGSIEQEPWKFDEETLRIYRKYVNMRYELIPYFYDCLRECEQTGIPMMRPLVLEYEKDAECFNLNDEFMVGSYLLAAPVVQQGATKRMVYLPEGKWYGYEDKKEYTGGNYYLIDAPIDQCPIFVREGAMIPTYEVQQYLSDKPQEKLVIKCYPGEGSYVHYQDNGMDFAYRNGEYNEYLFTKDTGGAVSYKMLHEGYKLYQSIQYIMGFN